MSFFFIDDRGNVPLYTAISELGLTSNLKLCLDAADAASYSGTGTKWLDTAGSGYDFNFGDGATPSTYPTFTGQAGTLSVATYFQGDGGDYFTYDSAIETWMQSIGKNGGVISTVIVAYIASADDARLWSTRGAVASARGCDIRYVNALGKVAFTYTDADGSTARITGAAGPDISGSIPGVFAVGFSTTLGNGNGYVVNVNGVSGTGTLGSNATSNNATSGSLKLMAAGDGSSISPAGSRLYAVAIWEGSALTTADFNAIYANLGGKYGV